MDEEEFIGKFSRIAARVQPEHRIEFLANADAVVNKLEDKQFDENYFGQIARQYIGAKEAKDETESPLFQAGKGLSKLFQKVAK